MLLIVLCGYKTWSSTLKEVFEGTWQEGAEENTWILQVDG
jgi:hypothetical protein